MTESQKKLIEALGLTEADFQKNEEQTTMQDIVDAMNILTEIVLGGAEE